MDFGYRPADMIFVRPKVDVSELDLEIARLRPYEQGFAELAEMAKIHKARSEYNGVLVDLFKGTLQELIQQGCLSREEVNTVKDSVKKRISVEDQEILATKTS